MSLPAVLVCLGLPFYAEVQHADLAGTDALAGRMLSVVAPDAEAVFTAPIQRGDHPFRELLPSWNVDAPPRTGFVVELRVEWRVDADGDSAWSPWMHVGDWGEAKFAVPLAERVTRCAGGAVDVDVFRGERAFEAAQLRVRARALDPHAGVRVRRLTLCFSDRERAVDARPTLDRRPWGTILDVPPRSQRAEGDDIAARICSPTSVAMVLAHFGVQASTRDVAARALDSAHDLYGVWPRNVQAAYSFGVSGYVARFSDWAEVERLVAARTPLVVSIGVEPGQLHGAPYASTPGHLLVLLGFDAAGDCVVGDPAAEDARGVRRTYLRSEMETVWMRRGGTAYVFEGRS
jgi:hypothetical protein